MTVDHKTFWNDDSEPTPPALNEEGKVRPDLDDRSGLGGRDRERKRAPEQTIWTANPCWRGLIGFYVKATLIASGVMVIGHIAHRLDLIGMPTLVIISVAAIVSVYGIGQLLKRSTVYEVTTRRVTKRWGIVYKHQEEAPLQRVQNIRVQVTFWGRIFRVGCIDFDTAADERRHNVLEFWGVDRPFEAHRTIMSNDSLHEEMY